MSNWQFYLDGNLVNDPIGFDDSVINLERDSEIDGLFIKYTNKLKWYGAAYDYIKSVFDVNFCNTISVKIYYKCSDGNFDLLFSGMMILSEIEFDEQNCIIDATIEDDSFSGKITRNKNIQAKLDVAISKNGFAITPVTPVPMHFYTVSTGNILYDAGFVFEERQCFWIYDCLKFLIDFMTDGSVGFASDYFSTGYGKIAYITLGKEIRLRDGLNVPMISFKDLFVNLRKKFNISFSVKLINGQRIMRIEDEAYFYQNTTNNILPNVPDIMVKIDDRRLYANVKVGSANVNTDFPALSYPTEIRFLNWREEQYHVLGDCNVDTTLDLVGSWIADSNSIEDILLNLSEANDNSVFFITSDDGITANKGNPFGTSPPYYYNRELMNDMVIPRWLGGIPNSIAAYLGNGNDEFEAHRAADTVLGPPYYTQNPGEFSIEVSDPNSNYNNATFEYIAPKAGIYFFESRLDLASMILNPLPNQAYVVGIEIQRQDSASTPILTLYQTEASTALFFSSTFTTPGIYLDATDKVIVIIDITNLNGGNLLSTSYFKCVNAITGGGIFADFETKSIRPFVFNFKYPVTYSDFKSVIDNNAELITFYKVLNNNFDGWLEKIVYPVKTGLAQWTIISKKY